MMFHFNRINPKGLRFTFIEERDGKTRVIHGKDVVVMDIDINTMGQCYYNWQQGLQFIQDAFPNLPPEHREFLLTGITPEKWNEIFSDVKGEE